MARHESTRPWTPLGAALLAFHHGRRDAVLRVDSDAFATEEVPVAAYYRPDTIDLSPLELTALDLCRGRVLDAGAGAGRHALELQRRGHQVTAIDIDAAAVQVMRARGVRDARLADVASTTQERYDTALLLMNGIGIAGEVTGLDGLLAGLVRTLAHGGQILCDSADLLEDFDRDDLENLRGRAFGNLLLGEVSFRLSFDHLRGGWYPWLFAAADLLRERARTVGLSCEIVARGPRGAFLARLRCEPTA
jgi:SAM-dependent methyltransferase